MKNIGQTLAFLFAICSISIITSCGDDAADCSNPSNWFGTYTIIGDTICSTNPDIFIVPDIDLEPSPVAETFEYEGRPFSILDCTATDGFFTFTKDGNRLTVELNTTGCSWEFTK